MTTDPTEVPAAAVQIVAQVPDAYAPLGEITARDVVAALHREGWLHDPQRVAELEAENERLRERERKLMRERDAIEYQRDELIDAARTSPGSP